MPPRTSGNPISRIVHVTAPSTSNNPNLGNFTTLNAIRDVLKFKQALSRSASALLEDDMTEYAFWTFPEALDVIHDFVWKPSNGMKIDPKNVFECIRLIRAYGMKPLGECTWDNAHGINVDLSRWEKSEFMEDIGEVQKALNEANGYASNRLINTGRALRSDRQSHFPTLFARDDGPGSDLSFSLRRIRTIVRFLSMQPPHKNEKGETWVEHAIGSPIIHLFIDERESWAVSCNTKVELASGLSASTGGAHPDISVQSTTMMAAQNRRTQQVAPGVITFIAEAKKEKINLKKAIRQMALALHPTMLMLIIAHYREMKWEYNRPLTSDSLKNLDESSFVFSIFYAADQITVLANYPYLEAENPNTNEPITYRWKLGCSIVKTIPISPYPSRAERLSLFFLLAFVEQHAYKLKNKFEKDDVASYFNDLHKSSELLGAAA